MTSNVMQEYTKITQEEVFSYIKLIFENSYSKKIALRYMDAYLNVRFYNFYPKDDNLTFRKNYLNAIKEAEASIVRDMPEKRKLRIFGRACKRLSMNIIGRHLCINGFIPFR